MMGGKRWIWIGLAIALVPLVVWVLLQTPAPTAGPSTPAGASAPVPSPGPPSPSPAPARIPPLRVEGTAIATVDPQGRRQWDLRAQTVSVDGAAGVASLTTVVGTYFQAGEPAVTFAAPKGTFYIATRNVTLAGRVQARTTAGRTLEADEVKWFPKTQQIEAAGTVVLRQPGIVVRADALTADVTLQRTTLNGNIRVEVAE